MPHCTGSRCRGWAGCRRRGRRSCVWCSGMSPPCSWLVSPTARGRGPGPANARAAASSWPIAAPGRPVRLAVADAVVAQVRRVERRVVVVPDQVPPGDRPDVAVRRHAHVLWKARTAFRVAVPNSRRRSVRRWRLSLSSRWTTLTASPDAPGWSGTISFSHVVVRTMPSAVRPFAAWKVVTPSRVAVVKMPSLATARPCARRRPSIARTSVPRLPRLWFGKACVVAASARAPSAASRRDGEERPEPGGEGRSASGKPSESGLDGRPAQLVPARRVGARRAGR